MDDITMREKVDEVLFKQACNLDNLTPGTKEHTEATKALTDLYKVRTEDLRSELEVDEKINRRAFEKEEAIRISEIDEKNRKKDRVLNWVKFGAAMLFTGFSFAARRRESKEGYKFEETGVYSSQTFRDLRKRPMDSVDFK